MQCCRCGYVGDDLCQPAFKLGSLQPEVIECDPTDVIVSGRQTRASVCIMCDKPILPGKYVFFDCSKKSETFSLCEEVRGPGYRTRFSGQGVGLNIRVPCG